MDEEEDKRIIVEEILENLDEVVKNQWGAFVIQHSEWPLFNSVLRLKADYR